MEKAHGGGPAAAPVQKEEAKTQAAQQPPAQKPVATGAGAAGG